MKAPVLELSLLPEVECTRNLCIGSSLGNILLAHYHFVVVEVVVNKEISTTLLVLLEHFEGKGNKLTVGTESIQNLSVGLCLCTKLQAQRISKAITNRKCRSWFKIIVSYYSFKYVQESLLLSNRLQS